MNDLPCLDEARCVGCADCVVGCPAGCLEMDGPLPWLPRPAQCVSCSVCARVCPVEAIRMPSAAAPRPPAGEG